MQLLFVFPKRIKAGPKKDHIHPKLSYLLGAGVRRSCVVGISHTTQPCGDDQSNMWEKMHDSFHMAEEARKHV